MFHHFLIMLRNEKYMPTCPKLPSGYVTEMIKSMEEWFPNLIVNVTFDQLREWKVGGERPPDKQLKDTQMRIFLHPDKFPKLPDEASSLIKALHSLTCKLKEEVFKVVRPSPIIIDWALYSDCPFSSYLIKHLQIGDGTSTLRVVQTLSEGLKLLSEVLQSLSEPVIISQGYYHHCQRCYKHSQIC